MSDQIKAESEYSSEEQILLPMCNLLPANEIISKNYEADREPIIKLITKEVYRQQEEQKYKYKYDTPKNVNSEIMEYSEMFGSNDYLGLHYANKMDQMVYLKFNNKDYNQLKVNEKKYRFFGGFFADKEHFSAVATQKYQNIMKSFPFLNFQDYNANILQSFASNTKGLSYDPKFSSNYDSANLFAAIRIRPYEYDLILQNDTNSKGNIQWFNFLVNFTEEGKYKINIVNFTKSHSLYEEGMKIACYSFLKQSYRGSLENIKSGSGWFRGGANIKYFRNNIQRESLFGNESYYTLSFEYNCKNRGESIIFAHSYPYTGLDLEKYMHRIMYRRAIGHLKMEKMFVCDSVAGQPINAFVITHRKTRGNSIKFKSTSNFSLLKDEVRRQDKMKTFNFSKMADKKNPQQNGEPLRSIVLMARQHSGETQSSYVLEGMVDFLMANTELDQTKKSFIFFILPMVNIDGVKYGHYRTNMNGVDLNRVWRTPRKDIHPEVYYVKKFLLEVNRVNPISFILDIHGHSKSMNSFFYGNPSPKKESINIEDPKIFPYICSKRIKEISYKQSTFNIREDKKNSARVVLSQMFPKSLVYTFENSFYGYTVPKAQKQTQNNQQWEGSVETETIDYTPESFRRVGRQLLTTYLQYTKLCEKNSAIKVKWMKEMESIYAEMEKSRVRDLSEDDGGSDSEAENDLIDVEVKEQQPVGKAFKPIDNVMEKPPSRGATSPVKRNIFHFKRANDGLYRRGQKKKTMPLPKTICDDRVHGGLSESQQFSRNMHSTSDLLKGSGQLESEVKDTVKEEDSKAVLSIFKIETKKNAFMRKKASISSLLGIQQSPSAGLSQSKIVNSSLSPNKHSTSCEFQDKNSKKYLKQSEQHLSTKLEESKTAIHFKKKSSKKDEEGQNVQNIIKKCSGMKTFLKAMGITIENRKG